MKTLEEIKEHLSEVGYNRQAMLQIEAFALGSGLITPNYEFDFVKGKGDFEDFMEWYTNNDEGIDGACEKGDYIHVEDEVDVMCLSEIVENKFVGTNGNNIHQYELTKDSRFCDVDEIAKIDESLANNGVVYWNDGEDLEPLVESRIITCECLDCMEVKCHEAIENIVASLHAKECGKEEQSALIESLKVLVELGKLYE